MPNFARQLQVHARGAAAASGQGRPSSSSFRSLNDDLHLSSHEISDHPEGHAPAEEDHPSLSDANVDDTYDYQFAIAPTQNPEPNQHEQKEKNRRNTRHQNRPPNQHPRKDREVTRIPLTQLNSAEHILDRTFGDSLQSLSENLSHLDDDADAVANEEEEELALRILEETSKAGRRAYGKDWDDDDDSDGGGGDYGYDHAYNYGGPVVSRRQRRHRVMMGCCTIAACAVLLSALLVGKGHGRHGHTTNDPLGLLSEDDSDGTSETDVWERVCSAHSISSSNGRHQCADACRIYDCCAADADEEESNCADQKEGDCERFWKLCPTVLDVPTESASTNSSSRPQRPSNWEQQQLLQVCGEANTNTAKFDQCQGLCDKHLCCLDMYGGGCVKLKEYQCHLYQEPCSILAVDLAQAIAKHVGEEHQEKVEGGEGGGRYLR